jgi:hypothetical protein
MTNIPDPTSIPPWSILGAVILFSMSLTAAYAANKTTAFLSTWCGLVSVFMLITGFAMLVVGFIAFIRDNT